MCTHRTQLQLKKVINRVASELEELGLTSEVLKELLQDSAKKRNSPTLTSADLPSTSSSANSPSGGAGSPLRRRGSDSTITRNGSRVHHGAESLHQGATSDHDDDKDGATQSRIEEVNEEDEDRFEGEGVVTVQQDSETDELVSSEPTASKGKNKGKGKDVRKRRVRATYELAGELSSLTKEL